MTAILPSYARYSTFLISLNPGVDTSTTNNTILYNLPTTLNLYRHDIALTNIFLYYSWFNVTSKYNNNFFQYTFPGSDGTMQTFDVNLPDGNYSIDELSEYMQFVMGQRGQYLVDNNGNFVYYLTFITNSVYYAVTLTSTPLPTTLPTGWTNPNNINLSLGFGPQLIVPAKTIQSTFGLSLPPLRAGYGSSFGDLIGFESGTYPPTPLTTLYQVNGTKAPDISPVSTVNININLVSSSPFNLNPQTIYSFNPSVTFGSQIQISPSEFLWLRAGDGSYNFILLSLTDQYGNPLNNVDTDIVCTVALRQLEQQN